MQHPHANLYLYQIIKRLDDILSLPLHFFLVIRMINTYFHTQLPTLFFLCVLLTNFGNIPNFRHYDHKSITKICIFAKVVKSFELSKN